MTAEKSVKRGDIEEIGMAANRCCVNVVRMLKKVSIIFLNFGYFISKR